MTFCIGEGSEEHLPEGVERALRRFQLGEKSKIELRGHKYTYGNSPPEGTNIPANAPLEFTIFLKEFEKVPATWEMTAEEKLEAAKQAKDRGTMFLQKGNLKLAYNKYKRAEEVLEYEKSTDPEKVQERDVILTGAYLNLSLVCSKQNEQLECIKWCDKVLETKPDNVKALYRKATALLTMNDTRDAMKLFEKIVAVEPENKVIILILNFKYSKISRLLLNRSSSARQLSVIRTSVTRNVSRISSPRSRSQLEKERQRPSRTKKRSSLRLREAPLLMLE